MVILRREHGRGTFLIHLSLKRYRDGGTTLSLKSGGLQLGIKYQEKQPGLFQKDVLVLTNMQGQFGSLPNSQTAYGNNV